MRIETDIKLDFDDVLIKPKRSTLTSRKEVDLSRTFSFLHSGGQFSGVPIMAANMGSVGNPVTAEILQTYDMFTCLHKFVVRDSAFAGYNLTPDFYAFSFGITDEVIIPSGTKYVCLDVANGYTETFVKFVQQARSKYPNVTIIAGNVCTPEMTEELILSGADIVKIGIGPGSACLTREKTGVGYPQLSAVIECADAAHGLKGHIIADGGCRTPSDIGKAFAAGADFVMLGGMLAGHEENSTFDEDGNAIFYGMSSSMAMKKFFGKVESHRTSEGRIVKLENKGTLHDTIHDILGGVRSTCTYVGASKLKELSKRTTFIRVNNTLNRVYESRTIGQ